MNEVEGLFGEVVEMAFMALAKDSWRRTNKIELSAIVGSKLPAFQLEFMKQIIILSWIKFRIILKNIEKFSRLRMIYFGIVFLNSTPHKSKGIEQMLSTYSFIGNMEAFVSEHFLQLCWIDVHAYRSELENLFDDYVQSSFCDASSMQTFAEWN